MPARAKIYVFGGIFPAETWGGRTLRRRVAAPCPSTPGPARLPGQPLPTIAGERLRAAGGDLLGAQGRSLRSPGRGCRGRAFVKPMAAITRERPIENRRLKRSGAWGTLCMPEGSGTQPERSLRRHSRPLLEAISCFRATRDFNLPGRNQTALTLVGRQARQTVRPAYRAFS